MKDVAAGLWPPLESQLSAILCLRRKVAILGFASEPHVT